MGAYGTHCMEMKLEPDFFEPTGTVQKPQNFAVHIGGGRSFAVNREGWRWEIIETSAAESDWPVYV